MSGFSRQWLQLREAADHRARSRFGDALGIRPADRWHIVDLGCGTGSNLRYLAPRFGARQHWVCIDDDADLLTAITGAEQSGEHVSIQCVRADIAIDIEASIAAALRSSHENARPLVSASALLDLVSRAWIDSLVAACARARAAALFALTYDGGIELRPEHRCDAELRKLVNAHQRSDKGFGPALGPDASDHARRAFERHGYRVVEAQTDWCLDSRDGDLQRALLAGWLDAAREQSCDRHRLAQWHDRRLAHLEAGELAVRVGHRDMLALPPATPAVR